MADPFNRSTVLKFDPMKVHRTYERWPSLAREGFGSVTDLASKTLRKVYVLGMGGSAAGGDIVASWLSSREGVEMAVFKGGLPIGDLSHSLAIAISASGETLETIEMLKTAVTRGATAVSISSGGRLAEVSKRLKVPNIRMPKVVAPRYMLPFIVFSCLAVANSYLELNCEEEANDAFRHMEKEAVRVGVDSPSRSNPSKTLALDLLRHTPAIYGARVTRGVGIRFKNVLNENSKKHAIFDGIPDAFHNEIEAWEDPRSDFRPVFLRHSKESKRDGELEDRMFAILSKAGREPLEVRGSGRTSLAQLMTMTYRLDMTSYYLALGLGRDPFPTRLIDELKH